jgi:hypothetical protein
MAAYMIARFGVGDYDEWKQFFDADPAGRKAIAKGHRIFRSVDDPGDVFIRLEFASVDDAKTFRERLLASGALDRVTVRVEPTVVAVADEATY